MSADPQASLAKLVRDTQALLPQIDRRGFAPVQRNIAQLDAESRKLVVGQRRPDDAQTQILG